MKTKTIMRQLCLLGAFSILLGTLCLGRVRAQEPPASQNHEQAQTEPKHEGIGGELAKEEREATGEEEENANLKHSSVVKKLAKVTGMSVHAAHLVALYFNFAVIVFLIWWFARKIVPQMSKNRTETIQHALEEARAASQDANRRLAEIESRLEKLGDEIGQMQSAAEKEAVAEEMRIKQATEDDVRKIVESAEQEIAAAAKQARRELTEHTADLAVALAQKKINVDLATDQVLVTNFAENLSLGDGGKGGR